jgi:bacterioferritin (cytochrome b1)
LAEREGWRPGKFLERVAGKGLLKQTEELSAAQKEALRTQLKKFLEESLLDEEKANNDYTEYANIADKLGLTDIAQMLRSIAYDEAKHYSIIHGRPSF